MPKYRTLQDVAFVQGGKAKSVKADRVIELAEDEAKQLAGRVVLIDNKAPTMFPNGAPYFNTHIVRPHAAARVAGEPVAPEPKKVESKAAPKPKPESK